MSRNSVSFSFAAESQVAPREGRVSRNCGFSNNIQQYLVAPREGRVSRNLREFVLFQTFLGRAPRGACE